MSRRCDYYPSDTNKNQIKWMVIVATDPGLLMNGDFCFSTCLLCVLVGCRYSGLLAIKQVGLGVCIIQLQ